MRLGLETGSATPNPCAQRLNWRTDETKESPQRTPVGGNKTLNLSNRLKMMEAKFSTKVSELAIDQSQEIENQDIYRKNSAFYVKSDEFEDINDRNSDISDTPNFKRTPIKAAMETCLASPCMKRPSENYDDINSFSLKKIMTPIQMNNFHQVVESDSNLN